MVWKQTCLRQYQNWSTRFEAIELILYVSLKGIHSGAFLLFGEEDELRCPPERHAFQH